jgi:hypothetical protein
MDRFHFIAAVWGDGHTGLFLDIGLPSLLSANNLPAMAGGDGARFQIFTRDADRARIEAAPVLKRLRQVIEVEFTSIDGAIGNVHETMSRCHRAGLVRAAASGAAAVFIPPDCIWADGAFASLERIAAGGARVVHMTGIRLDRDSFAPAVIEAARAADGCALTIAPRALARLGLRHLHAIARLSFFREHGPGLMPTNLFWSVGADGILARCFHLHPLMVRPSSASTGFVTTIDDDLALLSNPDGEGDYIVTDSDELLAFEMSPPDHRVGADYRAGSVDDIAAWAELGMNRRHRALVGATIRIHGGDIDETRWGVVAAEAQAVIGAALALVDRPGWRLMFSHRRNFWHRSQAVFRRRPPAPRLAAGPLAAIGRLGPWLGWLGIALPFLVSRLYLRGLGRGQRALDLVFGIPPFSRPWHWRWRLERALHRPLVARLRAGSGQALLVDLARPAAMVESDDAALVVVDALPDDETEFDRVACRIPAGRAGDGDAIARAVRMVRPGGRFFLVLVEDGGAAPAAAGGIDGFDLVARDVCGGRGTAALHRWSRRIARLGLARWLAARPVARALPLRLVTVPLALVAFPLIGAVAVLVDLLAGAPGGGVETTLVFERTSGAVRAAA